MDIFNNASLNAMNWNFLLENFVFIFVAHTVNAIVFCFVRVLLLFAVFLFLFFFLRYLSSVSLITITLANIGRRNHLNASYSLKLWMAYDVSVESPNQLNGCSLWYVIMRFCPSTLLDLQSVRACERTTACVLDKKTKQDPFYVCIPHSPTSDFCNWFCKPLQQIS